MSRVTQKQRLRNAMAYLWLQEGINIEQAKAVLRQSRRKEKTHVSEKIAEVAATGDGVLVSRCRVTTACSTVARQWIDSESLSDNIIKEAYK